MISPELQYTHISSATTTQIATGRGVLHVVNVNTTAAAIVTIYDETGAGVTNVIGVLKASIAEGPQIFDIVFSKGLKIITAGASDLTVSWRQ